MTKCLILGAGPAGLAFANRLLDAGINDFLVLEAESECGGLCRSKTVDGAPLDIGGGHFLDVRRPEVNKFLFSFMPQDEWNLFIRDSRIKIDGQLIHHPLEANIWEMALPKQVDYLLSIASAGCNVGKKKPRCFVDWIRWKLGDKIADYYMLPYNRKMFGKHLNKLGTYWLEKLPNVSFEDTLYSCLTHKAHGQQPGHAQFFYPRNYGFGELWRRMGLRLGERLRCNQKVKAISFETRQVFTSSNCSYNADYIVTTIPWKSFELLGMPNEFRKIINTLKHTSCQIEYIDGKLDTPAHWIYCPAEEISYHRILVRHNFCPNSRGYWTETNGERINDLSKSDNCFLNEYAYPLNTIGKNEQMTSLLAWSASKSIFGLGRWGEHQHYNSDLTVERSLNLADKLIACIAPN